MSKKFIIPPIRIGKCPSPIDSMAFHVGPFTYTLVISNRSIFDSEGNECEGMAVEGRRLLLLSHIVEPERREEVTMHEFGHAWDFFVPPPHNAEERVQLNAFISRQFYLDLDDGGGREALLQMQTRHVNHLGKPAAGPLEKAMQPLKKLEELVARLEAIGQRLDGATFPRAANLEGVQA